MALKSNISYNERKDKVTGFVTDGQSTKPEYAGHAQVFMIREAGFIVVATVCDQGANNRNAIKLLLQETRGAYLRTGREPKQNVFVINEQEIVHIYDPPHLLKCVRNNLITKNLAYIMDNHAKTAKWQHLELLLKENPGYR
ncbi:Parathyroid hormone-responsive B1, partial [Operophtera brumata]